MSNSKTKKTSIIALTTTIAATLTMASPIMAFAATSGTSGTGTQTTSGTSSNSSNNTVSNSVYNPPSGGSTTPTTTTITYNSSQPPNPQHVALAKQNLTSLMSSVQSLISSNPILSQTNAAATISQQQQAVNNLTDQQLAAFYTYVQQHPGWNSWLQQEQSLLQQVQQEEKLAGINPANLPNLSSSSTGSSASLSQTSTSTSTSSALNNSSNSTQNSVLSTSASPSNTPGSDSLTVTINQTIQPSNSNQNSAQTISDPTVINFTNVPTTPTPNQAFAVQLAADLTGMGANIAQSAAGDAPSELIVVAVGEGSSVPDPARIVAEAIAIGLYTSQEALQETANYLNMEMTNNTNLQSNDLASIATANYNNILTDLNNLATVNNNVNVVNKNVGTVNSNVNVVDQHVQTLSYRNIESDLESGTPLISLYLPVQDGGYLQDIEAFVQQLLKESANAGIDVSWAQTVFNEGTQDITKGAYLNAYMDFASAYRGMQAAAVIASNKVDKGPDHLPPFPHGQGFPANNFSSFPGFPKSW